MVSSTFFIGVSALAAINAIIPMTVQTTPNFQHLLVSKLLFYLGAVSSLASTTYVQPTAKREWPAQCPQLYIPTTSLWPVLF